MKKLLNLWVHEQYIMHCLRQKSQHLRLLFIKQYMNSNHVLPKRVKKIKIKKKTRKTKTWEENVDPNIHLTLQLLPYVTVCIPRFLTSTFSSFFFFFFFLRVNSNLTWVHCSRTVQYCSCTVQYCSYTVYVLKKLKMGLTILFKHLKIILLQCFQFSVFSFQQQ